MAVHRTPPKCYMCNEPLKGIYANRGKHFVGDSFVRWDQDGHKCDRDGLLYFIEREDTREWYRVLGQWTREPLKAKFFRKKEDAEEWLNEQRDIHISLEHLDPFPKSVITEHLFQ